MIASWMLYSILLTLFLAGAAIVLERAAHLLGRPSRRIWGLALLGGALLPQVVWVTRVSGETDLRLAASGLIEPAVVRFAEMGPLLFKLDQPLLVAWGIVSALLLAMLALALVEIHRNRKGWGRATVDGVTVRVSENVGPAVVGLVRSEIVLPRWVLTSEELLKRLVLNHEQEHVREGDPRLMVLALLVPILMPWNLVAWWIARRLRIAVEMDCDARVLRRSQCDVRTYGSLLLEMGRRRGRSFLPMAAFSKPRSQLEYRIDRMTRPLDVARGRKAGGLAFVALMILASAGFVPTPPAGSDFYIEAPWLWCDGPESHRSAEVTPAAASPESRLLGRRGEAGSI